MSQLRYFILCLLLISAFASADNVIWQRGHSFVSLAVAEEDNHHPVDISAEKLVALLTMVRYISSSEIKKQLFDNPKNLHLFAQHLSLGLSKANAQQDVRFLLLSKRQEGGFFGKLFANGGRIFYQNGKLNIIFSELLSTLNSKNIYGQQQSPRPWKDASRQVANPYQPELLATQGIAKKRSDWLLIDTDFIAVSAPDTEVKQSIKFTRPVPAPATDVKMSLEQRLRKLKELKQKDLISDVIYQRKVNQILEEL